MDIKFDSDRPVTFRLVEGNGPVHIAAEHLIGLMISTVNNVNSLLSLRHIYIATTELN